MSAAPADLLARVEAAIREVAAEVIEPRFGRLRGAEVHTKASAEIVTVADEDAERQLARRLKALRPGTPIVGEEACSVRPELIEGLKSERAWLVDPLDGTANFVAGSPDWAVMVALVDHGETVASWIWRADQQAMYVAERGSGAARDGVRLQTRERPKGAAALRGAVLTRFVDGHTKDRIAARRHRFCEVNAGRRCAGCEYSAVLEGDQDFVLFWRALPWDHAPGALLVREAGGVVSHLDGTAYQATSNREGLPVAADQVTWQSVRNSIFDQ